MNRSMCLRSHSTHRNLGEGFAPEADRTSDTHTVHQSCSRVRAICNHKALLSHCAANGAGGPDQGGHEPLPVLPQEIPRAVQLGSAVTRACCEPHEQLCAWGRQRPCKTLGVSDFAQLVLRLYDVRDLRQAINGSELFLILTWERCSIVTL